MSEESSQQSDDEWLPFLGDVSEGRFKWGWNGSNREAVVWSVDGPGDGFPNHNTYLAPMWGRPPSWEDGDILGDAWFETIEPEGREVVIQAFSEKAVPESVVAWFRREDPDVSIRLVDALGLE